MIVDLIDTTPPMARELKAILPSNEAEERKCATCWLFLDDLASPPERQYIRKEAHRQITDIAAALARQFSKEALALALAYDGPGLTIGLASRDAHADLGSVAKEAYDTLAAGVNDFEAVLRVLKMAKSPRARQAAREAASAGRLVGARRRNLPL